MSLALSDLLTCCRGLESDRATERKVNTHSRLASQCNRHYILWSLRMCPPSSSPFSPHAPRKKPSTSDGSYGTQMWCRSWIVPPDLKPKAPSSSRGILFLGNLLLYVCQKKTLSLLLSSLCLPFLKFLVVFSFHVHKPLYAIF